MKAIVDYPARQMNMKRLQSDSIKIKKASHQESQMQELFFKLKELVPNCDSKMSKTELLQNVIDYIFDLEETLGEEEVCETKTPLSENQQCNKMDIQVTKNLAYILVLVYLSVEEK